MAAPPLVPIVESGGTISYVRPEDVEAVKAEGARVATRQEQIDAGSRAGGGGALATADAFLRGATFGASDYLQVEAGRALGGERMAATIREQTESLKRVHGDVTDMAEVLGGLAVPVPGSGAAKGLGTGAAKLLGGAAERSLGKGALTFALEHGLPAAAQGAWEGAVQGMGSVLSESALGDHEVTAEKLFAGASKGALFGGAIGGGIGIGAGAVERGLSRAAGKLEDVGKTALSTLASAADDVRAPKGGQGLAALLSDQAEQQAFKATGAKITDWRLLGKTAEQQSAKAGSIGRRLIDEGIVTAGASKADIAERVAARVTQVGEELGALRKQLDTTGAKVDVDAIVNRAHESVIRPLAEMPGAGPEMRAAADYLSDLSEKLGPTASFEKLHEVRAALDKKLGWDKLGVSAGTEQLRQIRGIVEEEFTAQAEKAAALKGESFAAKYNLAKEAYSELKTVQKITSKETAREAANRAISLTDTIAAVGGVATMGPAGLLAAGANKGMREYGNQFAAIALDKLSRLESVQRAAASIDDRIAREAAALGRGGTKGAPRLPSRDAAAVAREVIANPEAIEARVSRFVGQSLMGPAPNTHRSVQDVAIRAATFLAAKAPASPPPVNVLQPKQEPRQPTAADVQRFSRYVEAIDDPTVVVRGLANGQVSREQVEAVRAVYPRLFAVMQGRIQEEIAKLPKALPYPTRVALSVMFDVPLDASMSPQMVAGFQQQYRAPQAPQGGPPARLDVQKIVQATAPATSRIEGGP